jgi:hypothetical protein
MIDTGNFLAVDKASGHVVNIATVPRGNACNCKCVNCGGDLQARKGSIREMHFKHISGTECNPETVLHQLAKRIFHDHDSFILPENKGRFSYGEVKEEVWLDYQKPDIVLTGTDKELHIEVAVTSFITAAKRDKIKSRRYNTIEIDLSKIARDSTYEEIQKILIEGASRKSIIFWNDDGINIANSEKTNSNWLFAVGIAAIGFALLLFCRPLNKKKKF